MSVYRFLASQPLFYISKAPHDVSTSAKPIWDVVDTLEISCMLSLSDISEYYVAVSSEAITYVFEGRLRASPASERLRRHRQHLLCPSRLKRSPLSSFDEYTVDLCKFSLLYEYSCTYFRNKAVIASNPPCQGSTGRIDVR